jgi:hypothetical protein
VKILGPALKYLLISLAIIYATDWIFFQVRQARGTAMRSISVQQYLATPLKGNKAEYDYLGTTDERCSQTFFPQYAASTWNPPCWWLERHHEHWE